MDEVCILLNVFVTPITHICNLSFKNGIFPENIKTAKIIPIFKSGDREDCTNYRPISLLPQISKILEKKLFNRRLTEFLENIRLLVLPNTDLEKTCLLALP